MSSQRFASQVVRVACQHDVLLQTHRFALVSGNADATGSVDLGVLRPGIQHAAEHDMLAIVGVVPLLAEQRIHPRAEPVGFEHVQAFIILRADGYLEIRREHLAECGGQGDAAFGVQLVPILADQVRHAQLLPIQGSQRK